MNKFSKIKRKIDRKIGGLIYDFLKKYKPNAFKSCFETDTPENIGRLIYEFLWHYKNDLFEFSPLNETERKEKGRQIYEMLTEFGGNVFKTTAVDEEERKEIGRILHESLWTYNKNLFPFNPVAASGNNSIDENVKLYEPYFIVDSKIEKGTYIAQNAIISNTNIGKFCSIGPNLTCGFGIHPLNGISTSPCFYSTKMQNGMSFANEDKTIERKEINIGNDVFIGMNVSILDGITIADGAVIAAGAVVTKDVEPYSIVGGVPAKHIKYRFEKETVEKLLKIQWWNWDDEKLKEIERSFFDVDKFIEEHN